MWSIKSTVLALFMICWAIIGFIGILLDPRGKLYMAIARYGWGPYMLKASGLKLTVKGAENIDWSVPYVVTTNHASQFDILVLFASLRMPVRFLAKRSLFYIPIFGWSLWLARFIPVDRGATSKSRSSINKAAQKIRNGPSLIVFPEGTRTKDGKVKKFKSGAFIMAVKAQIPVLPVAIRGTYNASPKGTYRVIPGDVECIIGSPVPTAGMDVKDKEGLRKEVQGKVEKMFESGTPV